MIYKVQVTSAFFFFKYLLSVQREKKDNVNPRTLHPRKIKTRKDEWERLKMGKEFVVPKNEA